MNKYGLIILIHSPVIVLASAFFFIMVGMLFKIDGYRRAAFYNILLGTVLLWGQCLVIFLFSDLSQLSANSSESIHLFRYMNGGALLIFSLIFVWLLRRRMTFFHEEPSSLFILLLTLGLSVLIAGEYLFLSIF